MIYIAHRGNLTGPNPSMENNPDYCFEALKQGFDVEVDVWRKGADGEATWWLGHEKPEYQVDFSFLKQLGVWSHCKTFDTFRVAQQYSLNAFMQKEEVYVTTSNGYMWWHEGHKPFSDMNAKFCILTALSVEDGAWLPEGYHGLCTDYAKYCRDGKPFPMLIPTWFDASEIDLDVKCNVFDTKAPESTVTNPFDILFLDVDGVLTNYKEYDHTHTVISKSFVDKDFTAIKRMKAAGVEVVILSGDDWNKGMAEKRKIKFIHTPAIDGVIDKKDYAMRYLLSQGISPERSAYIGDDFYDISLLEKVGVAYCPQDAIKAVKEVAFALDSYGGDGCIAEIYDRFEWNETYPYDFL